MLNIVSKSQISFVRSAAFYNSISAKELWESVSAVSAAGRKKGRGKARGKSGVKNLNLGQKIGVGREDIELPGLNTLLIKNDSISRLKLMEKNNENNYQEELAELRNKMDRFRKLSLSPFDRGYTGGSLSGRRIGTPDLPSHLTSEVQKKIFDSFSSKILEYKNVFSVTANEGRKKRASCFAISGNGKGLAGFALGKALEKRTATKLAKNRTMNNLLYIPLYENRTVFHNFQTEFFFVKMIVEQKPKGYGLSCHRVIKTICEHIGIKDLRVKLEGSSNPQCITKAFFMGLLNQETHLDIANRKKLHVIIQRPESDWYPQLLASPTTEIVRQNVDELDHDIEETDFDRTVMDGRVPLKKGKPLPFYTKLDGWKKYLRRSLPRRNQRQSKIDRLSLIDDTSEFYKDFRYPSSPSDGNGKDAN
ncbi:hypothetical protein SNEBB_001383 [Seison nebaliae]|nr:hypothetical protein SNEBB_001383 [Seison nebaliae]